MAVHVGAIVLFLSLANAVCRKSAVRLTKAEGIEQFGGPGRKVPTLPDSLITLNSSCMYTHVTLTRNGSIALLANKCTIGFTRQARVTSNIVVLDNIERWAVREKIVASVVAPLGTSQKGPIVALHNGGLAVASGLYVRVYSPDSVRAGLSSYVSLLAAHLHWVSAMSCLPNGDLAVIFQVCLNGDLSIVGHCTGVLLQEARFFGQEALHTGGTDNHYASFQTDRHDNTCKRADTVLLASGWLFLGCRLLESIHVFNTVETGVNPRQASFTIDLEPQLQQNGSWDVPPFDSVAAMTTVGARGERIAIAAGHLILVSCHLRPASHGSHMCEGANQTLIAHSMTPFRECSNNPEDDTYCPPGSTIFSQGRIQTMARLPGGDLAIGLQFGLMFILHEANLLSESILSPQFHVGGAIFGMAVLSDGRLAIQTENRVDLFAFDDLYHEGTRRASLYMNSEVLAFVALPFGGIAVRSNNYVDVYSVKSESRYQQKVPVTPLEGTAHILSIATLSDGSLAALNQREMGPTAVWIKRRGSPTPMIITTIRIYAITSTELYLSKTTRINGTITSGDMVALPGDLLALVTGAAEVLNPDCSKPPLFSKKKPMTHAGVLQLHDASTLGSAKSQCTTWGVSAATSLLAMPSGLLAVGSNEGVEVYRIIYGKHGSATANRELEIRATIRISPGVTYMRMLNNGRQFAVATADSAQKWYHRGRPYKCDLHLFNVSNLSQQNDTPYASWSLEQRLVAVASLPDDSMVVCLEDGLIYLYSPGAVQTGGAPYATIDSRQKTAALFTLSGGGFAVVSYHGTYGPSFNVKVQIYKPDQPETKCGPGRYSLEYESVCNVCPAGWTSRSGANGCDMWTKEGWFRDMGPMAMCITLLITAAFWIVHCPRWVQRCIRSCRYSNPIAYRASHFELAMITATTTKRAAVISNPLPPSDLYDVGNSVSSSSRTTSWDFPSFPMTSYPMQIIKRWEYPIVLRQILPLSLRFGRRCLACCTFLGIYGYIFAWDTDGKNKPHVAILICIAAAMLLNIPEPKSAEGVAENWIRCALGLLALSCALFFAAVVVARWHPDHVSTVEQQALVLMGAIMMLSSELRGFRNEPNVKVGRSEAPNIAGCGAACGVLFIAAFAGITSVRLVALCEPTALVITPFGYGRPPGTAASSFAFLGSVVAMGAVGISIHAVGKSQLCYPPGTPDFAAEEYNKVPKRRLHECFQWRIFRKAYFNISTFMSSWQGKHIIQAASSSFNAYRFASLLRDEPARSPTLTSFKVLLCLSLASGLVSVLGIYVDRRSWKKMKQRRPGAVREGAHDSRSARWWMTDRAFRVSTILDIARIIVNTYILSTSKMQDVKDLHPRTFGDGMVPIWVCVACTDKCTRILQGRCDYTAPPYYNGCFCRYKGVPKSSQRSSVVLTSLVSGVAMHMIAGFFKTRHSIFQKPLLGRAAVWGLSSLPFAMFATNTVLLAHPKVARQFSRSEIFAVTLPLTVFLYMRNELARFLQTIGTTRAISSNHRIDWDKNGFIQFAEPSIGNEHLLNQRLERVVWGDNVLIISLGLHLKKSTGEVVPTRRGFYRGIWGPATVELAAVPMFSSVWTIGGFRVLLPVAVSLSIVGFIYVRFRTRELFIVVNLLFILLLNIAVIGFLLALDEKRAHDLPKVSMNRPGWDKVLGQRRTAIELS